MMELECRKVQAVFKSQVAEVDLQKTPIINYLSQKAVLTAEDEDHLSKIPTNHEKNRHLLEILETKEDAAYGHFFDAVKKYQPHLADSLQRPGIPWTSPQSRGSCDNGSGKAFEDFSVRDLQEWLQPCLQREKIPDYVLEQLADKEIDGKVFMNMTDEDLKEMFTDLKFGPRKKLALLRDEAAKAYLSLSVDSRAALPRQQQKEHARQFGKNPKVMEKYHQSRVLNIHETQMDSTPLSPAQQCFPCCVDNERADIYTFIAGKVIIFAAACMNDRRNGTIYFGVGNKECEQYSYGEILGIPLDKKQCEDEIMRSIENSFSPDTVEAALKCIPAVVFVEVVLADREEIHSHFVCEVDIQPKTDFVADLSFFLNLADSASSEKKKILYRLHNNIPTEQKPDQVIKFAEEKNKLSEERQHQDKRSSLCHPQNLLQLLKNFLCGGTNQLDGSFCHLLAVGAVDASRVDVRESFEFVADMDWRGILDFDPKSGEKGLYQYMEEKEEKLYIMKMVEKFHSFSEADPDKQFMKEDIVEDMDHTELKPWIFCNGLEEGSKKEHNLTQWKKERSAAFREAVGHFAHTIPKGRAVVIILLTSKDDTMIEASEELLLQFQDQWVMMAESEQLANEWINGLQQRNVEVDLDRCLHNFSFAEINKALHQLMGSIEVSNDACFVKSSSGLDEEMTKKQVHGLCDLDILSTKTCSKYLEDENEFSKRHEENFYRCNPATWWNFHFPGHVCPRDKLEDLKTKTRTALEGDVEGDENVGFVAVYHQPGSGGTTLAMNVLWDLHSEFKCCRLKRITTDTARQLVTLYGFGESSSDRRKKAVLVMIDNENYDEVNHLKSAVEEKSQNIEMHRPSCVFLMCIRCMTLPENHQAQNVLLQQKLSIREKQFFMTKYCELKKKDSVSMENLLSLNIMKEDFNEDYIKRIVAQFVQQYNEHEQKVLQHIALLNRYDLLFRAIPVPCFDQLMTFQEHGKGPWENRFIPDPLMLYTTNNRLSERNKCLRVTSPLLCRFILGHLAGERSHGDLMEEFLFSPVFQKRSNNFFIKDLLNIAKDCMKKRGKDPSGMKRCKFSPFIQKLMDAGKANEAVRYIEIVFERTDDAFLAQQIARVYIVLQEWDEAEKWTQRAIKILPENSFVMDTHGQIFKTRLAEVLAECDGSNGKVDSSVFVKAVKDAHSGYKIFQRVQALNYKERNDPPNVSGLFGQMEVALILCNILEFHPAFPSRAGLQKFLSGSDKQTFFPVKELDSGDFNWLMSLEHNTFNCLKEVENQKLMCAESDFRFADSRIKNFLSAHNIQRFEKKLNDQFGAEDTAASDLQRPTTESRQRVVTKLAGISLYSIMSQCGYGEEGKKKAEKIWHLTSLSLKDQGVREQLSRFRDLTVALSSVLTLVGCHDKDLSEERGSTVLKWSMELFQMTEQPDPKKFISIDPYIFVFVFHWPTPNRQHLRGQCEPTDLKKAIGLAKEAFRIMCKDVDKKDNPIFFLTRKPGRTSVVSKTKLQAMCDKQTERNITILLNHPKAIQIVEQFSGILMKSGAEVKMQLHSSQGKATEIFIPLLAQEGNQALWNKKVSFALGVRLGGPVACDVHPASGKPIQSPHDADRRCGLSSPYNVHTSSHAEEQTQKVQLQLKQILSQKQGTGAVEEKTKEEETGPRKDVERRQKHSH